MTIEQSGFNESLKLLNEFSGLKGINSALKEIGVRLTNDAKLNFRKRQSPSGVPWQPTKRGGHILVDTGRLRSSITSEVNEALSQVEIGTNVDYAQVHNEGFNGSVTVSAHKRNISQVYGRKITPKKIDVRSHSRKMNIVKREFLGFYQKQENIVNRVLGDWIEKLGGQYE